MKPRASWIVRQVSAVPQVLTAKQGAVLDYIRACVSEYGAPPTRIEISDRFGYASPNSAEEHLRALERKGAIELVPGISRGIRIRSRIADTEAA